MFRSLYFSYSLLIFKYVLFVKKLENLLEELVTNDGDYGFRNAFACRQWRNFWCITFHCTNSCKQTLDYFHRVGKLSL